MTSEDRAAAERLRRSATTSGPIRLRCQLLLPSDGWSPPRIAAHLAYHPPTVRAVLRCFPDRGVACLPPDAPGPPPDTVRRQQVTDALAAAFGEQGIERAAM